MKFNTKKLHFISLFFQGLLLTVHFVLLLIVLFVIEFGLLYVFLFLLTLALGIYQWGISASLNIVIYKKSAARWRWVHWLGSVVYTFLALLLSVTFADDKDRVFIIFLIAIPHLIGYLYFWADYQEYSKKYLVQ